MATRKLAIIVGLHRRTMATRKLAIIVGGYLGDEGKGKATQTYLHRYGYEDVRRNRCFEQILCIRSSGGTNTGATVYTEDEQKLSIHMLPAGAFLPHCNAYLGSAVYLNMKILIKELKMRENLLGKSQLGRIFISNYAHVVTGDCLKRDAAKEAEQKMGSTKNGVSIAASDKYAYKGITLKNWIAKSHGWRKLLDRYGVETVDPIDLFRNVVEPNDWNMVLEGTQGVGLDVNHGFQYPYVSSGSFSSFGLLDGVGYALAPDDICMVLKPYGSYFGPKREAGDFENDEFREFAGEFGTTTGRPRNLCWLDAEQIRKAAALTRPNAIMVNCMDKLNWFAKHGKQWSIILDDEHRIDFDDYAMIDGKLTTEGALFIETIEEYARASVKFLGVGPKHDDVVER